MSVPTALSRPPSDSSPDHGEHLVQPPTRSVHDPFCIVVWKFAIADAHVDSFRAVCDEAAARVAEQPKTLFQRTTHTGDNEFQVRVGLEDSFGVLGHVVMFSDSLKQITQIGEYRGLEIHGPGSELAQVRDPLQPFAPVLFERTADNIV